MDAKLKVFRTCVCVPMSVFRVFVRYELRRNVPVAIFFGTVDSNPIVVCARPRLKTLAKT